MKAFYVSTEDVAPQQAQDLLNLAVKAGANPREYTIGSNEDGWNGAECTVSLWNHFGVNDDLNTFFADRVGQFGPDAVEMTYDEAWTYLDGIIRAVNADITPSAVPVTPDNNSYQRLSDRVKTALGDRDVPITGEDHLVGQVKGDAYRARILDKVVKEFNIPVGFDIVQALKDKANKSEEVRDKANVVDEICENFKIDPHDNVVDALKVKFNELTRPSDKLYDFCVKNGILKPEVSVVDTVIEYMESQQKTITELIEKLDIVTTSHGETNVDRSKPRNKYDREIIPGVYVDVYDVLYAFDTNGADVDHAVKKLLAPGQRGVKDAITDYKEAIKSLEAKVARLEEWGDGK